MTRARQILLFLGACTFAAACGGDDDDGIIIADSGPTVDSGPDASLGCGDYEEAADATNDALLGGTAEASGITFAAGDTKVVCGVIDPANMDAEVGVVDIDGFDFENAGAPMRVVMRSDGAGELGGLVVLLQEVTEEGAGTVGSGGFVDGYALANGNVTEPGTYRFSVFAVPGEELPAAPIAYQLEVSDPFPCEAAAGEPNYVEDNDGARSRRNDVVSVDWEGDPALKLTRATGDEPEPTELTLDVDTPVLVRGTSADVTANDDYHDKDAYLLALGEGVNEIDVRLTWPNGDIDMDVLTFLADNVDGDLGGGTLIGTMEDELFTARAPADASIWLWAGAYNDAATDLPVDYDITLCPRSFTP